MAKYLQVSLHNQVPVACISCTECEGCYATLGWTDDDDCEGWMRQGDRDTPCSVHGEAVLGSELGGCDEK